VGNLSWKESENLSVPHQKLLFMSHVSTGQVQIQLWNVFIVIKLHAKAHRFSGLVEQFKSRFLLFEICTGPHMIPARKLSPYRKWSRTGNGRLAITFGSAVSGIWTVNLKFTRSFFYIAVKLSLDLILKGQFCTELITVKFENTSKPQPIGHVRYINILTSIRGFRVKIANF